MSWIHLHFHHQHLVIVILPFQHRRVLSASVRTALHRCVLFLAERDQFHLLQHESALPADPAEPGYRLPGTSGRQQLLSKVCIYSRPLPDALKYVKCTHNILL